MGWRQRSRKEWQRLVAGWPSSGLTQEVYCTRVSVLPNTSFRRLVASPIMMAGPFGEERHHGLAVAQSERVAKIGGSLAA